MKEFSKEIISIDGNDYTLFLNRKGMVAYEKYIQEEKKRVEEMQKATSELYKENDTIYEINDDTNPFDEDVEKKANLFDELESLNDSTYIKLYWIMMYEHHKLPLSRVKELFNLACEDYTKEKVIELAEQMIADANSNRIEQEQVKNLTALRPKK